MLTPNTTYLYAFRIDGLGAASQTLTGWVLDAAQYDRIKAGGITEAELTANNTQTGTLTKASSATFTGTDYLRLLNFSGNTLAADLTTSYDEIRFAGANINEAITGFADPSAAAPEPGSIALVLMGGAGVVGTVVRRKRGNKRVGA